MHIPWVLHLITIILTCCSVFHSTLDVTYADYKDPFTDNGLFSTSNNKSSKAIRIKYPSFTEVHGITIYEKLLATALDNIIIVYDISSSVRIENVHRIQLPKSIRGKLLEFKFIDHEMLLFCDALTCRLCMLTSPEKPCVEYLLTLNGKKTEELLCATAVKDSSQNINIRIVTKHANHAAILRFPSYYTISKTDKLVSLQSAEDIRIIDEHSLATAFNRRGYTFFVGSARRPYEPYINARIEELIVMSVRITRICDKDRTEKLESRIDMALTCGNFSKFIQLLFKSNVLGLRTNVVSLAAEYDRDSDELIVVFQTTEKNENVACKYNMDLECQKVQNLNELPPHCFIFSRRADGHAMRTCSKFGGVSHQTHQMTSSILWSLQLQQPQLPEQSRTFQFRIAADLSRRRIYFVQDNDLSYTELSCSYFYDSCDSLEQSNWSDPLQCLWCAMNNGSGYAFPRSKGIDCPFYTVDNLCAPFIEHVNIPSSNFLNYTSFEVYGRKFDRLQDIVVKVCNQNCTISHLGSAKLSCTVNRPSNAMENCNFYLEGKLGSLGRFNITFEVPKKRDSHITSIILASTHSHSKYSRAVATIFAVIVLSFLIVLILCLLRQFHKRKQKRMKQCGKSGSQISLDTSHAPFVNNNPFSSLKRKGDEIKTFNPYENLFLEIDPKLQISLKNLELGDEIGKGNADLPNILLLDAYLVVKIADFGLSRDVSQCGMYQAIHKDRGIPIRWMPIESLEEQQVSLFIHFRQFISFLFSENFFLYYHVMRRCWMEDPKRRPTFFELTEMMEDVVRQLRRGVTSGAFLDSHYERVSARSFTTSLNNISN
ncbi:unnamed protein product [Onchocerca flexuosa]|uniref:TyrKc domain-containing protein n=1 Tax=Onchocerca flexuosa TaxID=387005 RepID=A0A183I251_9BILA|nr:unnamed protein product [Onchocerca flexuosa]